MFVVYASIMLNDGKNFRDTQIIVDGDLAEAQKVYQKLIRENDTYTAGIGVIVQSTDAPHQDFPVERINEIANNAVEEMGDIFFDPDPSMGEYSIPANIAHNRIQAAILQALTDIGLKADGVVLPLPESEEPETEA